MTNLRPALNGIVLSNALHGMSAASVHQQQTFDNVAIVCNSVYILVRPLCICPGSYRLDISSPWGPGQASVDINIIPCPKEYVTGGRYDTCNPCPEGMYSFNASDATCSLCPANALCPGLGVVLPVAGFWKSAPQSVQVHRCACGWCTEH